MTYFVVSVQIDEEKGIGSYEDYIRQVKPLVELHGGKYLVRSEKIQYLGNAWKPDRLIIICFLQGKSWMHVSNQKRIRKLRIREERGLMPRR